MLEMTLKMLKHTRNGRRRNCVGFLSAEELFEYKCDKLLIHLSVSSHQRRSRWGLHSPVLCQRNCHICLIFKFHLSVQPSVFKTNRKGKSSLALDQVFDDSWYPKGGQGCHKGFHPLDHLAARAERALFFKTKPRELKSKLHFLAADLKERSAPWSSAITSDWLLAVAGFLWSMLWKTNFTGQAAWCFEAFSEEAARMDLCCIVARSWCYCKSHESLVLSYSPGSIQQCDYVKNELEIWLCW